MAPPYRSAWSIALYAKGRITYHGKLIREPGMPPMSKMSRFGSRNSQRNILPAAWPLIEPALIFNQALALHKAGDLIEAEKLYRQVLKVKPDHFDSLHLLGVSYLQRSRYAEAVRIIDMALKINPHSAFAHNNRGNALKELKQFDEALESHDRAIEHKPDYADALFHRGNTLETKSTSRGAGELRQSHRTQIRLSGGPQQPRRYAIRTEPTK